MTIYLYKKIHNKTGLQYLGKTSKDPYAYSGFRHRLEESSTYLRE